MRRQRTTAGLSCQCALKHREPDLPSLRPPVGTRSCGLRPACPLLSYHLTTPISGRGSVHTKHTKHRAACDTHDAQGWQAGIFAQHQGSLEVATKGHGCTDGYMPQRRSVLKRPLYACGTVLVSESAVGETWLA